MELARDQIKEFASTLKQYVACESDSCNNRCF